MNLLADENVETEWVQALRDDGHDVLRVVDVDQLGVSASDQSVLRTATEENRVLLTADQSDFTAPPIDDHSGIIIETQGGNPPLKGWEEADTLGPHHE